MYATSRRCIARAPVRAGARGSFAPTQLRFLSSHGSSYGTSHGTFATRPPRPTPRPCHHPTVPTTVPVLPAAVPSYSRRQSGRSAAQQKRIDAWLAQRRGKRVERKAYSGKLDRAPSTIAVLGGGLTGLTTAYYLTRALPRAKITIYEADARLGGWIDTEKTSVKTPDGNTADVYFERAARMIKPQVSARSVPKWDDAVFFDLVSKLNLADELMHSPKGEETVAGFIYYPDHLVGIPSLSKELMKDPARALRAIQRLVAMPLEPVFRDLVPSIINVLRNQKDPQSLDILEGRRDMSIGDYYAHRFGRPGMVDKVMSAMIHGITGGDVWKQSMASGFLADTLAPTGNIPITKTRARLADMAMMRLLFRDKSTFDLAAKHVESNAIWFRNGFSTLTNALARSLQANPNVTINQNDPATWLHYAESTDNVLVMSKQSKRPATYDKVISTIYAKSLAKITRNTLPSLDSSTAVTIMLVNIWYPVPQANFPNNGFGYLLPQALPHDQNPECVLGVIFDSDREFPLPSWSHPDPVNRGADTVQGTKLTVMLGGHYWDDLPASYLPSEDDAVEMAKRAVARHLNLHPDLTAQAHASAKLCRDCIPQHLVGHRDRMRALHNELEWGFKGRLAVAGGSYQNPGVLPLLRAAWDVAAQVAGWQNDGVGQTITSVGDTGLLRFTRPAKWVTVERNLLPLRGGSRAWVDDKGHIQPGDEGLGN